MPCTNKGIYRIDIFVLFADCLSVSQSVCLSGLFFKGESSVKLACLNLYSHDLHALAMWEVFTANRILTCCTPQRALSKFEM